MQMIEKRGSGADARRLKKGRDMKKEIKVKSVAQFYAFAAVWLIWGLFLPLYNLWHLALVIVISVAAGFLFARLFPGKTIYIEVPDPDPVPFTTGNDEANTLISEGERALAEMRRLEKSIDSEAVSRRVDEIADISEKIIQNLRADPGLISNASRFLRYYLPTTIKLLNAYDRMYDQGIEGTNISGSMTKIEDALGSMAEAYRRQLDAMFEGQALDIETDIAVLEGMLKREGLTDADFPAGDTERSKEHD